MFTMAKVVEARGPDYPVSSVALSRDNKWVAAAVGIVPLGGPRRNEHPTEVRVWEVGSGRQVHALGGHKGWVGRLAFSPDGKWLASAGRDKVVRLWNAESGKEALAFPFDTPKINAIAFSSDSRLLAAGGGDGQKSGEVRVWACPQN
jgi:WD40 repeat protein